MSLLKSVTCFLVLISCAFGKEASLVNPCNAEDLPCVKDSTKMFLSSTADGIPQYDIKPLDPLTIPLMENDSKQVKYILKNTKVTGMKNLSVEDFKIDTTKKTVWLKTKIHLKYNTEEILIDYKTSKPQKYSGGYDGQGKAIVTITYPYDVKADEKGNEHFDVGAETITCEALEASASVEKSLQDSLNAITDPEIQDIRATMKKNGDKYMKIGFCELAKIYIFPTMVHNIRASANVLPKGAFFKNI